MFFPVDLFKWNLHTKREALQANVQAWDYFLLYGAEVGNFWEKKNSVDFWTGDIDRNHDRRAHTWVHIPPI